ncbi:MAG: hypothetical protein JWO03_2201 [Bacteroidetes bacterium]|nr:hypothetical protein [Bacteroidota bacterium]
MSKKKAQLSPRLRRNPNPDETRTALSYGLEYVVLIVFHNFVPDGHLITALSIETFGIYSDRSGL